MDKEQLQEKLALHKKWLNDEGEGQRADLRGADLQGADHIKSFGPMPTSGRMVYAVKHDIEWMVQAGCFWGTLDELEAKVKASHNCPTYLAFIAMMRITDK
jgi:hypothetical protein